MLLSVSWIVHVNLILSSLMLYHVAGDLQLSQYCVFSLYQVYLLFTYFYYTIGIYLDALLHQDLSLAI